MGKRLFVGSAIVPFEAPKERLKLLTVAGHPAIMQLPQPDVPFTRRIAVLVQPAKEGTPGILVWIDDTNLSEQRTVDLAAKLCSND